MKKNYEKLKANAYSDDCFADHKLKICSWRAMGVDVISHKYYKDIENEIYLNLKRFFTILNFDDFNFFGNIFRCDNQFRREVGLFLPISEMCHRVRHKKIRKLKKKI